VQPFAASVLVQPDTLDRDFQTFRQSRDPAALAAVFDAAAPRLLLVAMHLCRDAATAEDLVQTVFLQVLRDVDRFDARRPVLPWLLRMLEHRASDLRQRAHVRREQSGDAAAAAGGPSPERAAAANEVRERVAEALAGMPRDYRDVLALRLVHGLSSVEIAHANGLPPATVRTRLRRGLELLRGALPRSLATHGLLALLAAELAFARDGMAAVRTKVLAAGAGTGVTVAFGWWLAAAATLVLAAGGWWWFAPVASGAKRLDANATQTVTAHTANDGEQPRDDAPTRDATRSAAQRTAVADPRTTTVRGRVVDAATGLPIGGVAAKLRSMPWNGVEDPEWRDPEPVATAADGSFSVQFVPSRQRGVELGLATAGYVEEFLSWEPMREGVDVDAGDVKLQPGTPVRLRLLCDGKPLGGVETYASPAPGGAQPAGMNGHGLSDADGFVDLGTCEPGPWWHDVRTAHLGSEAKFDVPLQRAPLVVTVDLREPPRDRSISGLLVDTSGAPLPGIELGMRMPGGGYLTATTRSDGRFLWGQKVTPLASVREHIELRGEHPELEWVDDGGEVAWGAHELRLVVRRRAPATLQLEVVDATTGLPVESFGARCDPDRWRGMRCPPSKRTPVASEHHEGGVVTFAALVPGPYLVSVFCDGVLADCTDVEVQVAQAPPTTLRVALHPPAELVIEVADAITGMPLSGVEVMLARALPADRVREFGMSWFGVVFADPDGPRYTSTGDLLQVARGSSDERGRVSLRAAADTPGLVLYAGGPRCVASIHPGVSLPPEGTTTTIRVTAATVVRGTVTPRAFVERLGPDPERLAEAAADARVQWTDPGQFASHYPSVVLRPLGTSPANRLAAHVAADGTFRIGGVPAGRYAVHVEDTIGNSQADIGALATVDVDPARPGEPLTIDVSALVPARGTVRYFVDGAPAKGEGGLARIVDGGVQWLTFPLDGEGVATTPWLVPGTYVPFAVGAGNEHVFGTGRLLVSAGGSIDATFALQRRPVAVRVVDPDGEPARDLFVWTEAVDAPGLGRCPWLPRRTDADGRLVFAAAPPGRLRLRAFARDQDLRDSNAEPALLLGEVAADATAVTFRLPR